MTFRAAPFRSRPLVALLTAHLLLQACGDAPPRAQQPAAHLSTEISTPDSSMLVDRFGILPDRASLLSQLVQQYVDAIGGPESYVAVLERIGAKPSPTSVRLYGGLLMLHGAARLGRPVVDSLAAVRSRMFDLYYPNQCEFLVGSRGLAEGWRSLASIDSTNLDALFKLYAETTLAEMNDMPPAPAFDRQRLIAAWRAFFGELPPSERDRFVRFLDAPEKSLEDECWFQYHFWRLLPALPEADSRVILWQFATNRLAPAH